MERRISPVEAKQKMDEGWVYVDVRTEVEYAAGHPAGAINVPFMIDDGTGRRMNPEFPKVLSALFGTNARLILGCQSGQRSARASMALLAAGFPEVLDQRAGFGGVRSAFGSITEKGWRDAGLPVETTTPGGSYREVLERAQRPRS